MLDKILRFLKTGIASLFLVTTALFPQNYILNNEGQLLEKTAGFMEILSGEVFEKTGVSLYVVALNSLNNIPLKEVEESYLMGLQKPYVVLFFARNEKKIDILVDEKTKNMLDKNSVYWDYIVPLIPHSDKEIDSNSISVFLLNGFVDIADNVASYHKVELEHGFIKQNDGVRLGVKVALYFMLFVLLALFVFVYFRRR